VVDLPLFCWWLWVALSKLFFTVLIWRSNLLPCSKGAGELLTPYRPEVGWLVIRVFVVAQRSASVLRCPPLLGLSAHLQVRGFPGAVRLLGGR